MAHPSIGTVRDLKGKKIGITSFGSATHATARAALRFNQMDAEKDVTIMAMGTEPTYFAALQNGAIDAAVLTPPNDAKARRGGYRELAYSGDVLPEPSSYTFSSRNFALDQPDDAFREIIKTIFAQDRVIVESQRPEELPVDLTEELHLKGPDAGTLRYRRMLSELP